MTGCGHFSAAGKHTLLWARHCPFPGNQQEPVKSGPRCAPHLENCLSLVSMLLCLMHILVRAEPISLVPPAKETQVELSTRGKRESLESWEENKII